MRADFLYPRWAPGTTAQMVCLVGVSTRIALPACSDGRRPKFILLTAEPGATAAAVFGAPCNSTQNATTGGPGITIGVLSNGYIILNTQGFSHIALIATAGNVNVRVTPLENW